MFPETPRFHGSTRAMNKENLIQAEAIPNHQHAVAGLLQLSGMLSNVAHPLQVSGIGCLVTILWFRRLANTSASHHDTLYQHRNPNTSLRDPLELFEAGMGRGEATLIA